MDKIWYNIHKFNVQANNRLLQRPLIYKYKTNGLDEVMFLSIPVATYHVVDTFIDFSFVFKFSSPFFPKRPKLRCWPRYAWGKTYSKRLAKEDLARDMHEGRCYPTISWERTMLFGPIDVRLGYDRVRLAWIGWAQVRLDILGYVTMDYCIYKDELW